MQFSLLIIAKLQLVARDTTQVDLGVDIVNGGRPSQFLGRWAPLVAKIMCDAGLQCSVVRHEIYLESLVEKLLWSSIFWLLSASLGSISVGKIAKNYTQHVHELVTELMPLAQSYIESIKIKEPFVKRLCNNGCTGEDDQIEHSQRIKLMHSHSADSVTDVKHMVDWLCAYSVVIDSAVPSMQMAASEFDWRNGWFLIQKITPQHMMWLKRAGFCEDL
ncbi:hypothetical protein O6H91_Y045700 [Diphasiastrum complanatum]|nr:hypothetical protein O6H91_Y045700 [Diphasiastrum complanatum]